MEPRLPDTEDLIRLSREIAYLLGSDSESYARNIVKHGEPKGSGRLIQEEEVLKWVVEWVREEIGNAEPYLEAPEECADFPGALHAALSLLSLNSYPVDDLKSDTFKDLHGPIGLLLVAISLVIWDTLSKECVGG